MSRTGASLQDINGSDPSNIRNTGRQSPRTFIRNADSSTPVREYEIPIRLTGANAPVAAPQSISSRFPTTVTSTPAEKVPFLPSTTYSKTKDYPYNSDFDRPHSPGGGGPDRLALVDDMADYKNPQATWQSKLADKTRLKNNLVREFLAEFLGSFILIVFGNGAVAEVVLSTWIKGGSINDFFSINVAYGLAVGFGVYVAGGVSGGHLNPAVTLAFALKGATKWISVPVYWLAQYFGCFIGSAVIYLIYYDALNFHDGGVRLTDPREPNATAGIFASYPQAHLTWQGGLVDQIFATSFLMIGILALTDPRNTAPHKGVVPILVALLVMAIGLSYGYNCGYPINPARDLGPRIFTSVAGWGLEPFTFRNHNWFWIPVVGPHLGAILGLGIYQIFIGNQWPAQQRTGIELQVVRRGNPPDEYQLVKAAHVLPGDVNVPVSFRTNDPATERLLAVR